MTAEEVEAYLHAQIPLSAAMGVAVVAADTAGVRLRAPLAPNINHRETAFGGSLSALAVLAAWTLTYLRLREEGTACRLVIQRGATEYLGPAAGAFEAVCLAPPAAQWERFSAMRARHGRGRIALESEVRCDGVRVAFFTGELVALPAGPEG